MSFRDVYIGDLDDPAFHLPVGNENWDLPKKLGPLFPDFTDAFFKILHALDAGVYVGGMVDVGAFVAKVSKAQLRDFVRDTYDTQKAHEEGRIRRVHEIEQLKLFIEGLDPDKEYGLVAIEI